jgi:hypothetical protein
LSDAWKTLDLDGGGLQQANLTRAQRPKRRRRADLLLAAALGLHRTYLETPRGAWLRRAGAAAPVVTARIGFDDPPGAEPAQELTPL